MSLRQPKPPSQLEPMAVGRVDPHGQQQQRQHPHGQVYDEVPPQQQPMAQKRAPKQAKQGVFPPKQAHEPLHSPGPCETQAVDMLLQMSKLCNRLDRTKKQLRQQIVECQRQKQQADFPDRALPFFSETHWVEESDPHESFHWKRQEPNPHKSFDWKGQGQEPKVSSPEAFFQESSRGFPPGSDLAEASCCCWCCCCRCCCWCCCCCRC
ncbi:unnamed protein product [Polarella glacialis]|uniref:Uncharacterized protein n=1 Tax=Polarella glacialis TaxID=89957 RepID=A0A813DM21_POLGL|nr:unnamed protein product [Polarella glacialis]